MKSILSSRALWTVLSILIHAATAYPSALFRMAELDGVDPAALYDRLFAAADDEDEAHVNVTRRALGISPGFDATAQSVATSGAHAFVAPSASDLRGPCPGLNALANHNYLPHDGVATITQFVDATTRVFGMGADLATFLSVYGAVVDGDLTSWSIGGAPPGGDGILASLGLLSPPPGGISNSHNKYESDVSPTRGDLYEYGNDDSLVMSQFEALFSQQPDAATANYDLSVLTRFRARRFQESISSNPYFFNGPFSGVGVQPAAYTFMYRFMANHSDEYPEGLLNQDVLKSFFAITGAGPGSFVYTPGNEKIPDNWYRRAIGDEYSIAFFLLDLLAAAETYPEFLSIGGNTGTVNSFTGVNIADLTGGVYNVETLLEGDNLGCFIFQVSQQATPDLLRGLFSDITDALDLINTVLNNVLSTLSCPQLEAIDEAQFNQFPGYTRSL